MRDELLTGVRVRVQRRWRRLRAADLPSVKYALTAFRQVILDQPLCRAVVEGLDQVPSDVVDAVMHGKAVNPDTEREAASFGWALLGKLIGLADQAAILNACLQIAFAAAQGVGQRPEPRESPRFVVNHYLEPLFDYLDEVLDEQGELLGTLLRFQQWASWFG